MDKFKNNKIFIIAIIIIFVLGVIAVIYQKIKDKNNSFINYELENSIYQDNKNNQIENFQENNIKDNSNNFVNNIETSEICIHIIGEVNNQGIVILNDGDRIIDAIEKAGGVTQYADLEKVNLAFKLSDGQKVCIPNINDKNEEFAFVYDSSGENVITDNKDVDNNKNSKVNINTATQTELETLTGIGPSIAARIIQYRKENGKFESIEELKNVTGIGDSKFEDIRNEVVVK